MCDERNCADDQKMQMHTAMLSASGNQPSFWLPAGGKDWLMGGANLDKSIKYFPPSATWKQSADLALEDNISGALLRHSR